MNGMIVNAIREALAKSAASADELRKAITVSTGFNIQNWELGYRNLIPITPTWFRDRIFSRPDAEGNGIAWKVIKEMDANRTLAYVPEGKRAAELQVEKEESSCGWKTWGVEDGYTQEATQQNASLVGDGGTEDLCIANLGQCFAQKEERILWGANNDQALGTCNTPSGADAACGSGETSTLSAHKYFCKCVALTHDGAMLAGRGTGLVPVVPVTSPAGETYSVNGGCSLPSAGSSGVDVTSGHKLTWTVAKRAKDVYYAWFVGVGTGEGEATPAADSALYLQAVTSVPYFVLFADIVTSNRQTVASLVSAGLSEDRSCVSIAPNGIWSQLLKTTKWVHFDHLTPSTGALGLSGGQVPCLREAFRQMWNNLRIGPECILVSANTFSKLNDLALGDTATKTCFVFDSIQTGAGVYMSGRLRGVINPFTGDTVPFEVYPHMPDGWIVGARMTAFIPGQPSTRTVEVQSFGGVWRIDWQPITRSNYHGMYRAGGVKMYLPSAFFVITGVVTDTWGADIAGLPGGGFQM